MQSFRTPRRLGLALLLTLLIGACGGGGGGGGGDPAGPAAPAGPTEGGAPGGGSPADGNPPGGGPSDGGGGPSETPSWVSVDHDVDALPNTNYAATSGDQVVITLPASLNEGDVVRVRGDGQGGWKIAQHDGQMIKLTTMAGNTWTALPVEGVQDFLYTVGSSADGSRLVGLEQSGQIHISSDGGVTWQTRSVDAAGTPHNWQSVAISADGHHIAVAEYLGAIYISDDDGETWSPQFNDAQRYWKVVAWGTAADGSRLLAAPEWGGSIRLWSQASGWSPVPGDDTWMSVAFAANATKLVAVNSDGRVRIFDIGNQAWTTAGPALTGCYAWCNVFGSTDGMLLSAFSTDEPIYVSDDGGLNWTPSIPARWWVGMVASSDGNRLLAADGDNGYLYTSSDHGKNWTQREPRRVWCDVASSSDATSLVAVDCGSKVYTSISATTLGATGSISGAAGDSIDLKYIGNGVFQEVARTGSPTSQ